MRRGESIAKIGGGKKLIMLFVAEEDVQEISINQKVVVSLNMDNEKTYEAFICKIFPSFNDKEQSFIVEASFINEPMVLYHNSQLQANIIVGQKDDALVIPTGYISTGDSVLMVNGQLKHVKTGIRNDEWTEIVEGLDKTVVIQKPQKL